MNFVNFGGVDDKKIINLDNVIFMQPCHELNVQQIPITIYMIYISCIHHGLLKIKYKNKEDRDENFERIKNIMMGKKFLI